MEIYANRPNDHKPDKESSLGASRLISPSRVLTIFRSRGGSGKCVKPADELTAWQRDILDANLGEGISLYVRDGVARSFFWVGQCPNVHSQGKPTSTKFAKLGYDEQDSQRTHKRLRRSCQLPLNDPDPIKLPICNLTTSHPSHNTRSR